MARLKPLLVIDGLAFELTCSACPEQYDVWLGERQEQVGYVRVRWGHAWAYHPDFMGEPVYDEPIGDDDLAGQFIDDDQRQAVLSDIAGRLRRAHSGSSSDPAAKAKA